MRWKCGCSYDGTDYAGWQTQSGGGSVQNAICEALAEIFKTGVEIYGSGRTDAGVHAMEQVFHFDFDWPHGPVAMLRAMRTRLPEQISPLYVELVEDDFHARFSARSKLYQYRLFEGNPSPIDYRYCWPVRENLDLQAMASAIPLFKGKLDFAAFAANRGVEYESTTRHLMRAEIGMDAQFILIRFEADGFMYKMVRSLVGTLVNVGSGRISKGDVALLLGSGKRSPFVFAAPAKGLFLEKVYY